MKKLLIIDDDPQISQVIIEACRLEMPSEIETAYDGESGLSRASAKSFDAIILDLSLPDRSGIEICRALRSSGVTVPVVCLTSRGEVIDKVLGLEMGADDYIVKPFSPRELLARLRAIWRRGHPAAPGSGTGDQPSIVFGELQIHPSSRQVLLKGQELELSRTEFEILILLASTPGRVFTREELLERAVGTDFAGYDQSITSHVSRLRTKLGDDPEHPHYIRTVRGVGYRFVLESELEKERKGES